ncbi:MAG: flagellar export chaperone FlgN [Phycisphaerae bacterium]
MLKMILPHMNSNGGQTGALVKALTGQKELYVQLLALAKQQSSHVAAGDSESLMRVLGERSRVLDQVAPLDRELQPYKGRWQEVLDGLPAAEREVVGNLLKEVQQLLGDILAQDEQDKESLIRQKEQVGTELKRTVTGAQVNRAYGVKRPTGSIIG